jgi:hypothetical protein
MQKTTRPARLPLLALATGPILIAVGHALSTPIEGSGRDYVTRFAASRPEHIAGLLLTAIGGLLLLPGAAGVLRVLDGRSMLARIGCTLGGIGAAALGGGDGMIGLTAGTLTGADHELAARASDAFDQSNLAGVPFQGGAPLFVIGFVLLGIALVRLGGALRWPGAALVLGAVLVFASGSGGLTAAATLTPLAIAFAAVAQALWRQPQVTPAMEPSVAPALETA